ncbi:MAG: hypothetical protein J1E64_15135 [Acetatifactor sp.]|nr:hypothetical protein [Acetatifactor sp.]
MEVITYSNIVVEGFPFKKILSVSIEHAPNEHAKAEIVGEVETEVGQNQVQRVDETTMITVSTTAEGQPEVLFCGCVGNLSMEQENEYSRVNLLLYSTSRLLDMTLKNKTYQNTAKTYGQIIQADIADVGDLHMMVSDKAIGQLIMKYNETDWNFMKRMASQLNAPLIANLYSQRPQVYIGMPPAARTIEVESTSFSYGSDIDSFAQSSNSMVQDFAGEQVESYQYGYLGDEILMNGQSRYAKSVHAYLEDGILRIKYGLLAATAASAGGSMAGIAVPATANTQASGKMMKGIVQAVQGDKVQVYLTDVDASYDEGGNWWFPFSTAYSSGDGSGWYCMPEVGDEVRVFFPSGNEGEAFAASSVCANPPSNPRHKSWKAPGGKEILLTDEGMYIIGKSGKMYINLTDETGVEIHSDKDINITSDAKISISAADEIHVVATNEIIIGTDNAYLDLTRDNAILAADQVLIN